MAGPTISTMAGPTISTSRQWREVLPPHSAAELFPLLPPDELVELAEDIKKHGMQEAIVLTADCKQLVDGRNRLDNMEVFHSQHR